MRGTPARRSSRASGSGLWWNEVRITRLVGAERGERVDERADRGAIDRRGLGVDPRRGRRRPRRRRAAAAAACAPARAAEQRHARGAGGDARIAGPASSTSPALSWRATRTCVIASPPAAGRPPRRASPPRLGRRAHLLGSRRRRGHEHAARPRRLGRLDVGADVADHRAALRVDAERARPPRRTSPGRGLRQAQPSSGPCGQTSHGPSGPSSASTRALTASTVGALEQAAGDAALVGDDGDAARPRARSRSSASRAPGHRHDPLRIAVVGHVDDERPVAVEQHRLGPRPRAAGAAGARARRRMPREPGTVAANGMTALVTTIVAHLARRARPGRDPRATASSAVPRAQPRAAARGRARWPPAAAASARPRAGAVVAGARGGGRAGRRRARASRGRAARASARRRRCRPACAR